MSASDPSPFDKALSEIDQIGSLETARMTLRWALEKLRSLEQSAKSEEARSRGLLARDVTILEQENARVKAHAQRLEQRLAELAREGYDPLQLAKLESELERRAQELARRQDLAAEDARKQQELGAEELRLAKERGERESRLEAAVAREELSTRFVELNERLVALRGRERAFEERSRLAVEEELHRRAESEARLQQRIAEIEEKARGMMESALGGAQGDWQAERKLLLEQIADLRARARESLPAMLSARASADELEKRNAELQHAMDASAERLRRQEGELEGMRDGLRRLSLEREAGGRLALELRGRAEGLERALIDERRRAEEALGAAAAVAERMAAREQALKGIEELLNTRLREAERAMIAYYDSWRKDEETRQRSGVRWHRDVESRRRAAAEAQGRVDELRAALMEALKRYHTESRKRTEEDA